MQQSTRHFSESGSIINFI